jgi:hypothetical protein
MSLLLENTLLYKKFAEEREHILRNKWYMSERVGRDVGYERALLDWVLNKKTYLKQDKTLHYKVERS